MLTCAMPHIDLALDTCTFSSARRREWIIVGWRAASDHFLNPLRLIWVPVAQKRFAVGIVGAQPEFKSRDDVSRSRRPFLAMDSFSNEAHAHIAQPHALEVGRIAGPSLCELPLNR